MGDIEAMSATTPCLACPSPASDKGYCTECLSLLRHWKATTRHPQAFLVDILKTYYQHQSDRASLVSALFALTVKHYELPRTPKKRFIWWAERVMRWIHNPPSPPRDQPIRMYPECPPRTSK